VVVFYGLETAVVLLEPRAMVGLIRLGDLTLGTLVDAKCTSDFTDSTVLVVVNILLSRAT